MPTNDPAGHSGGIAESWATVHFTGVASGFTPSPSGVSTMMSLTNPSGNPLPGSAGSVLRVKSVMPKFGWPVAWVNHFGSVSLVH